MLTPRLNIFEIALSTGPVSKNAGEKCTVTSKYRQDEMVSRKAKPLTEEQITKLLAVLGPPPVLSSEDKEGYATLLNGHIAFYRPAHPMVVFLIKQLADTQWEIFRFTRNRSVSIERRFEIWRKGRVAELERKNKDRKQHLETLEDSTNAQRQAIYQAELTIKHTETRIKELATRNASTDEENVDVEEAAHILDRSDKWLTTAMVRQNNLLQLLEHYCGPADQRSKVAEAEFKEVQAEEIKEIAPPPLVPPEIVAHDVTTQNHNQPVELPKE
jgi:hypothetical protein